jgi:hypothetical protein
MMQKKSIVTIGGVVTLLGTIILTFAFYRATILECKALFKPDPLQSILIN